MFVSFHDGLSVPSFGRLHPRHNCHDPDPDVVEEEGISVVGNVVPCLVSDVEPDSARVISSAKRSRSSKATRSRAALSWAALASSSDGGLEEEEVYAHEPATTAAIVSPCAIIRTRSQLLNECDWPLRIFVIAITSATVVAAAPVCV